MHGASLYEFLIPFVRPLALVTLLSPLVVASWIGFARNFWHSRSQIEWLAVLGIGISLIASTLLAWNFFFIDTNVTKTSDYNIANFINIASIDPILTNKVESDAVSMSDCALLQSDVDEISCRLKLLYLKKCDTLFASEKISNEHGDLFNSKTAGYSFNNALDCADSYAQHETPIFFTTIDAGWTLSINMLSVCMLVVVSLVSLMIHIYSIGYMRHEVKSDRFMIYLLLFTFFMFLLVLAANPMIMFVGWEGVGLCSYLLIGYWFNKAASNIASYKAFIMNRIGDAAFIVALALYYYTGNTLTIDGLDTLKIFGIVTNKQNLLVCSFLIAAMAKSAQIFLHTWLPDAMEGPTPASALIHAATMVTAGVIVMLKIDGIISANISIVIMCIGAITAIFAGIVAMVQFDIKKVIAFSTCSQLGLMFIAIGAKSSNAALFHLLTHACFKALLFLVAGSIIHTLNGAQDMRNMGGLYRKMPYTMICMLIGSLALSGMFPFAGFYSKDAIAEYVYFMTQSSDITTSAISWIVFVTFILVTFMTAFYSFRMICMVFFGTFRGKVNINQKCSKISILMAMPMFILAVFSVFAGYYGQSLLEFRDFYGFNSLLQWQRGFEHEKLLPSWFAALLPTALCFGIIAAIASYVYGIVKRLQHNRKWLTVIFDACERQFFINEIQYIAFVCPLRYLFNVAHRLDKLVMTAIDNMALFTQYLGKRFSSCRTAFLYHNVLAISLGHCFLLVMITLVYFFTKFLVADFIYFCKSIS